MPDVVTFLSRVSTPVRDAPEHVASQVVVTDKLDGGAFAPIVPVRVKLSVAVIDREYKLLVDPLIAPEIICTPLLLTIEALLANVIDPEYVLLPLVNRIAPLPATPVP